MKIVEKGKAIWREKKDTIIGIGLILGGVGSFVGGWYLADYISHLSDDEFVEVLDDKAPKFTLTDCGTLGAYLIGNAHHSPDSLVTIVCGTDPEE